ncbi:MAG: hypothetical protein ACRDQA_20685 [Nocardioidaceae bacterium]
MAEHPSAPGSDADRDDTTSGPPDDAEPDPPRSAGVAPSPEEGDRAEPAPGHWEPL